MRGESPQDGEEVGRSGRYLEVRPLLISSRLNVFMKNREKFWIIPTFLGFINRERVQSPAVGPAVGMY